MNIATPVRMTVDQYLAWALDRPGRYELYDGVVVRLSPERALHARTRVRIYNRFVAAIAAGKVACFAMPDGMTVRIDDRTAFEPDALVHGAPRCSTPRIEMPARYGFDRLAA